MSDEKTVEKLPEDQSSRKPEPIAEDLNDRELEEASGGAVGAETEEFGPNTNICGWGC